MRTTLSLMMRLFGHNCLSVVSSCPGEWIWELIEGCANIWCLIILMPIKSKWQLNRMSKAPTNSADLLQLNQTVFSSLTSFAAEISVSQFTRTRRTTCIHILQTCCTVERTAVYPALLWNHSQRLCNTWTERHNSYRRALATIIILASVAKQLHTLISEELIKPSMHFSFFLPYRLYAFRLIFSR